MEPGRSTVLIAHVLFLDLVRSSALSIEEFGRHTSEFRGLVAGTRECRVNIELGRVQIEDTGDGLALAFLDDPTSPAECATQVRLAIAERPHLIFRGGIHSGPLMQVNGLEGPKLTGPAFVEAKRLMDACRPGEILVSREGASILRHFDRWMSLLGAEQSTPVKGGAALAAFPLLGRPNAKPPGPPSVAPRWTGTSSRLAFGGATALLVMALVALGGWSKHRATGASHGSKETVRPIRDGVLDYQVRDLGASTGLEEVCLNDRDQVVGGFGVLPGDPPAFVVDGRTGRRKSLNEALYRPQISDSGAICALCGHSIIWRAPGGAASDQITILPYEAAHGSTFINRDGARVFFHNAPGDVAGRWSMWNLTNRQVVCSLRRSWEDAYINNRDQAVTRDGPSVITYSNDTYKSFPTGGLPVGIADSGDIVVYQESTNVTSIYTFEGKRIARLVDFNAKAADRGVQTISSANHEQVLGRTTHGWSVYDVSDGKTFRIEAPGWKLQWVASITSKNEMVAVGASGKGGLRLLLLTPMGTHR